MRDLNGSHTLGFVGRNNSNPSIGSSSHVGDTRPGQTRKKPKDLSTREREERGCGEGGGVYVADHGIKGLEDKSNGMEILMTEVFTKINPTDPLILAKQAARRKRN